MVRPVIVSPSLLSSDFSRLGEELCWINDSSAAWVHCDVMDGVFVPNITFGPPVIASLRPYTTKILDVHLMIVHPERYIDAFADAGADVITVHWEACTHLDRTISAIRARGVKAGVALNPATPPELLRDILTQLDLVLIMSVNPGFGGQSFIQNTYSKLQRITELSKELGCNPYIEVDGGVSLENAAKITAAGANVLVAGNAIFKTPKPSETISQMLQLCHTNRL